MGPGGSSRADQELVVQVHFTAAVPALQGEGGVLRGPTEEGAVFVK